MSLTSAPFVPKVSAVSVDGVPGTSGVYDPMPSSAQTVKSIMTKFKPYLDTMVTAKEVRLKVQAAKKKIPTRMESVELEQVFEVTTICLLSLCHSLYLTFLKFLTLSIR